MKTLGIELCDAGFQAVLAGDGEPRLLAPEGRGGLIDWPGFAYHEGPGYRYGAAGEDAWFVHPRRVCHTFWSKLSHETAPLVVAGSSPSFSELAFFFLRDYWQRLGKEAGAVAAVELAVPGSYFKDPATEEERIGLLLGMAGELKLPLTGIVDMGCAALCDPRSPGINPALPVVVIDMGLHGTDLTLLGAEDGSLRRLGFAQVNQTGWASLLKHLTGTMGNRLLRHTAFDILADGNLEQAFYRQTKGFLLSGAPEHRYQINTAERAYELTATHEQLIADTQGFVQPVVSGVESLVPKSSGAPELCTVVLTARTACLPALESRLRGAGFARLLRLPAAAAASGAARLGSGRTPARDIADTPVETTVPRTGVKISRGASWDARLVKARGTSPPRPPTHVILEGIGHALGPNGFTVGAPNACADVSLPEAFNTAEDCVVRLTHEGGRLWMRERVAPDDAARPGGSPARTAIESGDRILIHTGSVTAELLFAHCPPSTPPVAPG